MKLSFDYTEEDARTHRLLVDYGIDDEEATVRVAINAAYKARFRSLQAVHGTHGVPAPEREALEREYTRACRMLTDRRNEEQEKVEAKRKRDAARAAAAGTGGASGPSHCGSLVPAGTPDQASQALAAFTRHSDPKEQ